MKVIGKLLGNRYEILEKIGSGGMANVYKAQDRMLNRYVAVKVLHSEFKEDEEFIRRFSIESQAAASLSHQNIVQIYDVGEEDGVQYIVMEYLNGQTLKDYIKSKDGGLYQKEAIDYSMQICRALEHAHQKHIIHRDIKPQNIMITTEGILKVTDFGIARAANNNTTKMTSTAIGSAHYLSPEQARGGYTDQRSDIYSLGVVMYELFTGQLPFDAETPVAVAMKHIQENPVPPSKLNPNITKSIEKVILKAMSKEVRFRYNSASELLQDLKLLYVDPNAEISADNTDNSETKIIDSEEINRRVNEAEGEAKNEAKPKSDARPPKRKRKKNSRNIKLIAAVAAIVTALAAVVGFVYIVSSVTEERSVEVVIPDFYGLTVDEAEAMLEDLGEDYKGFTIKIEGYRNDSAEIDTIISQSPEAEKSVKASREIRVILSSGSGVVVLGNYIGETYTKIESELTESGLIVEKEEENSDNFPSGIIVGQSPESGTSLTFGETVKLYVSKGSANAVVPNVIGLSEADARTLIERSGLAVGEIVRKSSSEYVKGLVCDQSYTPYTKVPEDTKVDIFISDGAPSVSDGKTESDGDGESGKSDENNENTTGEPSDSEETQSSASPEVSKPSIVDDPSQIEEAKTKYLTLNLPQDRTKVTVKLVCNGKVIYEKEHNTSSGTADISLKSRGTISVDIYYDDEFIATKEVKFN